MSPAERSRSQTSRRISRRWGAARASKTRVVAIILVYTKMKAESFTVSGNRLSGLLDCRGGEGPQRPDAAGNRVFGDGEGETQMALPFRTKDDPGHCRDPNGA